MPILNIQEELGAVAGSAKISSIPDVILEGNTIPSTEELAPPSKHITDVDAVNELSLPDTIKKATTDESDRIWALTSSPGPSDCATPVHQLPNETLTEIFLFLLPTVTLCSKASDVWHLMFVCRRWRYLALSTSELWSKIHLKLDLTRMPDEAGEQIDDLLHFALDKSKNRPLSIKLQSIRYEIFREYCKPVIFPSLWKHCARWECIEFTTSGEVFTCYAPEDCSFPALKEISFRARYDDRDFVHLFENNAPQLTRCRIFNARQPSFLKLPWSQLTLFEWSAYPFDLGEYISVLSQMPKLEELVVGAHNIFQTSSKLVELSHLRVVRMKTDAQSLKRILPLLIAPALKEITLEHFPLSGVVPLLPSEPVISLISRSKCTLNHLAATTLQPMDAFQILPEVPDLEHLELGQPMSEAAAILKFIWDINWKGQVPKLRILTLHFKLYEAHHCSFIDLFCNKDKLLRCNCSWCGVRAMSPTSTLLPPRCINVYYEDKSTLTNEAIAVLESKAKEARINITVETESSGKASFVLSKSI